MMRRKGYRYLMHLLINRFEINDGNMDTLARLADKYIIDSLQREIRVCSLTASTQIELYTQTSLK
jgi:hypothetical protein